MSTTRIGLGVAAGYLLGRTKKMRLAITVGSTLAGRRIATNPIGMIRQASEIIDKNPDLAKLQQRVTGELFDAVRTAAYSSANSRLESFNRTLTAGRNADADEPDEPEEMEEEARATSSRSSSDETTTKKSGAAKKSAAKKSGSNATKKTAAKKSGATKKSAAKRSGSNATKKTAAKKSGATKKSAAKKSAAKKSTSKRSRASSRG